QIGLQLIPDAGVWAFQAKPGETSRIVEVSYAYFLFRLDSLHAEGVPPFDQIKNAATRATIEARKQDLAKSIVDDFQKRLSEGSTLEQAAKALNLPHQTLGPFTRVTPPIPNPVVVGAAFGIPVGKTSGPIDTEGGTYFLRVDKREPADSAAFVKDEDEFRTQQIRLARQQRVRNYLQALQASAKVVDRRADIFKTEAQTENAADQRRS
ncbi:MAG TPA: peptidyl-prolyl cis-trans isomerase, partial [Gemmatimonadales bacterium]|nr:peptidyl-prolyl cis-trans isomerase [Gemmatimonadales bacterium]